MSTPALPFPQALRRLARPLAALAAALALALLPAAPSHAGETARRLVKAGFASENARAIERHLDKPGRAVAVFDHDLTLLHGDVCNGEPGTQPGLFREMVDRGLLKPEALAVVPPAHLVDPLGYFEELKKTDGDRAYTWRNGLLAGYAPEELAAFAQDYYDRYCAPNLYPGMKALIAELHRRGADVYVLSAAPALVIGAAAKHFGIPRGNVHGIWFKVRGGKVSLHLDGPNVYGPGKRWVIENRIRPADRSRLMTFGDSWYNDGFMLRLAKRHGGLAMMINPDAEEKAKCRAHGMPWAEVAPPRAKGRK